ncbi:hypothetical protein ACFFRR_003753 [Megaselia abdita]
MNLGIIIDRYKVMDWVVDADKKLSHKARSKLIHAIIQYTIKHVLWISQEDFPKIFEKIQEYFPGEIDMDLYFIPKSAANKNPSGPLLSSFRYYHRILQDETGLRKNKKRNMKVMDLPLEQIVIATNSEMEKLRKELVGRQQPWSRIVEEWKLTFDLRRKEITDPETPLQQVFLRWPKYFNIRGDDLIETDFEILYPGKSSKLFVEWPDWRIQIMSFASKKAKHAKEKEDFVANFTKSIESPWYDIYTLKDLFYCVSGGRQQNVIGAQCFDKLVHFIETSDDAIEKVKEISEGYAKEKLHPFILIALDENVPVKFYAVAYDVIYSYENFLGTLNCVFMMFFALNVPYPKKTRMPYCFCSNSCTEFIWVHLSIRR